MKYLLFFPIVILILISSCSPKITNNSFLALNEIELVRGESKSMKLALEFEKIYIKYHKRNNFEESLFKFLRTQHYKDLDLYYWISNYLSRKDYLELTDIQLSKSLLDDGLEEINRRLTKENISEDENLYLEMTKCQLLWSYGILNFSLNNNKEGCKNFDEAYSRKEDPSCIYAFPAMDKKEKEEIYKKYAKCKE